jgi:hypothetical protein
MQPQILALQGVQVDIINQLPVLAGVGLLSDPNVEIISPEIGRARAGCIAAAIRIRSGSARARRHRPQPRPQQAGRRAMKGRA